MRFRLLLLSILALAFLLASCSPPELRDPNLIQDDFLLTHDPCSAPCWRGITPGVTAWRDALIILEDDATLENVTVQEDEETSAIVAEWQGRGGSPGCCQMFSQNGDIVDVLFMRTAPTITLGDVIDEQGEPTFALATPFSDGQSILNAVYPEIPMVLYVFLEGTESSVTESSPIIGILLTTPDDMQELLDSSNLHTWEGFDSYLTYSEDSPFEVTPIPESTEEATQEAQATEDSD
jgi:hypothetical protein